MNHESRIHVNRSVLVLGAAASLLVGAGLSYIFTPSRSAPTSPPSQASTPTPSQPTVQGAADTGPLPDVQISLEKDVTDRAGIVVTRVSLGAPSSTLRLPGLVEPDAYRQVSVTPLVAGRVTRVAAQLGDRVRRGQVLAEVYSPELAEAKTQYISARARLDAHDQELRRTQKLVEIGAASRQELEQVHAEHTAQSATVASARSRLELLGVSAATLDNPDSRFASNAAIAVPAAIEGTVTDRRANVGLNVDAAASLFTIVDLSKVWIIADLYERDFSRTAVGSEVTVTTPAYAGLALKGRVSYIDPQVSTDTRTAKLRVEVPNPRHELRLGMYVDVLVSGAPASTPALAIPRAALQTVGDRHVVYLANVKEPGQFTEREVRIGEESGEQVAIMSGLQAGDGIVTEGSFYLRAERERLGLRPQPSAATAARPIQSPETPIDAPASQTARVEVDERGFTPSTVTLLAGRTARLTVVRTSDKTCATEVAIPSLKIKRPLPLNEPVVIELAHPTGQIAFACGMDMFRGAVVLK